MSPALIPALQPPARGYPFMHLTQVASRANGRPESRVARVMFRALKEKRQTPREKSGKTLGGGRKHSKGAMSLPPEA